MNVEIGSILVFLHVYIVMLCWGSFELNFSGCVGYGCRIKSINNNASMCQQGFFYLQLENYFHHCPEVFRLASTKLVYDMVIIGLKLYQH